MVADKPGFLPQRVAAAPHSGQTGDGRKATVAKSPPVGVPRLRIAVVNGFVAREAARKLWRSGCGLTRLRSREGALLISTQHFRVGYVAQRGWL